MPTKVLQVLTQYCDIYVDDDRLIDLKSTNFPQWALKMWAYLRAAIPLFNLPAEMQEYLLGTPDNPKLTEPTFYSEQVYNESEKTAPYNLISSSYIGYEYVSARIVSVDQYGDVYYTALMTEYDSEHGVVEVFPPEGGLPTGAVVELDFYKDGEFAETLSAEIMGILAHCFDYVWETRFINNWLSNVPKIEDASFKEQNRANKERADTERMQLLSDRLAGELRRFDENVHFRNVVRNQKTPY